MTATEWVQPVWRGRKAIVAATGPSLTADVVARCREARERGTHDVVAVQDAYRVMPWADVLYGCDAGWWNLHEGAPGFAGEKWSTHDAATNDKLELAKQFGLRLVTGRGVPGFSLDPDVIHYGSNSGFQAINLTILRGATRIVLVGFDMTSKNGGRHFFGDHPRPLHNISRYEQFIPDFVRAAKMLPAHISITNATPGSALVCFPMQDLGEALAA